MTLAEIGDELVGGVGVELRSFGVFYVRSKSQRVGRNPRTGEPAQITARRRISFRPSPKLISAVSEAMETDVSGHGVAAGILMSMIKSAATMQLTKLRRPEDLLRDLNDVLQPVTSPANYLTFAYVSGWAGEELNFALAGHLPILHYQRESKTVAEHSDGNLPIGLFKDATFAISKIKLAPGDLLALITDGFTEVFDAEERESGMGEFKAALADCAEKPLREIYEELRERSLRFGKQSDDQTMLLIRRLG